MLTYFSSNIGFSQSLGQNGNHTGMLSVFFKAEDTEYPVDTLMDRMMRRIRELPEGKLAEDLYIGGFNRFGKEIEVGLTSQNDASLQGAKEFFKKELNVMRGVLNVKDNLPPCKNEIQIELKPEAEIIGLTKGEILGQIRAGFFGQEAQRVIIGTDEVKIWVRYPPEDRKTLSDLENMKIKTMAGIAVPLKNVCSFEMGRAP
jgi:multidrug efflux pump subunit AcrB